jgi:hypothetical protein
MSKFIRKAILTYLIATPLLFTVFALRRWPVRLAMPICVSGVCAAAGGQENAAFNLVVPA